MEVPSCPNDRIVQIILGIRVRVRVRSHHTDNIRSMIIIEVTAGA